MIMINPKIDSSCCKTCNICNDKGLVLKRLLAKEGNVRKRDMKIGYARVSTTEQHLDLQIASLKEAGCEKIYKGVTSRKGYKTGLSEILYRYYIRMYL
jgi:predicted site-specific integrase-resolvase